MKKKKKARAPNFWDKVRKKNGPGVGVGGGWEKEMIMMKLNLHQLAPLRSQPPLDV